MQQAVSRLDASSAAGLDQLPPAFVKHAKLTVGYDSSGRPITKHVLMPFLSSLFHVCVTRGVMPDAWKVARLSPLYKKGAVLQPDSYRMLAVSSVLYRLYASVIKAIASDWAMGEKKLPDTQFGFVPQRDTMQPSFILRHLCHAAKWGRFTGVLRNSSRVYAAFMDFTQAYDRVKRADLWQHLAGISMPAYMLDAIRGMYTGDSYILVDGGGAPVPSVLLWV